MEAEAEVEAEAVGETTEAEAEAEGAGTKVSEAVVCVGEVMGVDTAEPDGKVMITVGVVVVVIGETEVEAETEAEAVVGGRRPPSKDTDALRVTGMNVASLHTTEGVVVVGVEAATDTTFCVRVVRRGVTLELFRSNNRELMASAGTGVAVVVVAEAAADSEE